MSYTITLTLDQLNIIGNALGEIPYRIAAPVIQAINEQLTSNTPIEPEEVIKDDIL